MSVGIAGKGADWTWLNASKSSYEARLTVYLLYILAFRVLQIEVSRGIAVRKACRVFFMEKVTNM